MQKYVDVFGKKPYVGPQINIEQNPSQEKDKLIKPRFMAKRMSEDLVVNNP